LKCDDPGFTLSRNDRKIVLFGQLLTTIASAKAADDIAKTVDRALFDGSVKQASLSSRHQATLW
jgi:hypothetical protein